MIKWLKNQKQNAKIAWVVVLAFGGIFGYKTVLPTEEKSDKLESLLHTLSEQNKNIETQLHYEILPLISRTEANLDGFIDQYNKQQINEQHQQKYLDLLNKYRD